MSSSPSVKRARDQFGARRPGALHLGRRVPAVAAQTDAVDQAERLLPRCGRSCEGPALHLRSTRAPRRCRARRAPPPPLRALRRPGPRGVWPARPAVVCATRTGAPSPRRSPSSAIHSTDGAVVHEGAVQVGRPPPLATSRAPRRAPGPRSPCRPAPRPGPTGRAAEPPAVPAWPGRRPAPVGRPRRGRRSRGCTVVPGRTVSPVARSSDQAAQSRPGCRSGAARSSARGNRPARPPRRCPSRARQAAVDPVGHHVGERGALAGGQVGGAEVHRASPHRARGQPPAGSAPAVQHLDVAARRRRARAQARPAMPAPTTVRGAWSGSMARSWGLRSAGARPAQSPGCPSSITDPADPRVADFRDLKAGDRPAGAAARRRAGDRRGRARGRAAAAPRRTGSGRCSACPAGSRPSDLPDDVPAYEADKWVLSEVIGFRLTRGVLASADRLPPAGPRTSCWPAPTRRRRAGWPSSRRSTTHENLGSIARSARGAGHRRAAAGPALRRPALPALGPGLDGARAGAAVRRPARLAGRPRPAARRRLPDRRAHPGGRRRRPGRRRPAASTRGRRCCSARRARAHPRGAAGGRGCGPGSRCARGWTPSAWPRRPPSPSPPCADLLYG